MSTRIDKPIERFATGIRNLDEVLGGGLPQRAMVVVAGPPGSGKTILSHQIGFHLARPDAKVVFFQTLGEPTAKKIHHLHQFSFFDSKKLESSIRFIDLGVILRSEGIDAVLGMIMEHVKKEKPTLVVIDSFKAFEDLVDSAEQHRKFTYEVVISLMAWECTTLLLGEFTENSIGDNPLFSVIDGVITMGQEELSGEQQRMFRVVKMRGTAHSRDKHSFLIDSDGIQLFAPRVTIRRDPAADKDSGKSRCKTGIAGLDELLGPGIPRGSSLLVAGASGTGKTVMMLDFIYQGATQFGEKGLIFSFEETKERLCAAALSLGWDLDKVIKQGLIEIVFVPHPDILIDEHLLMIRERAEAIGAKRIAVDSLSVFLHKIQKPQLSREKVFQLSTIVQMAGAVGLFVTDIPYGKNRISRFGIEETVVDGVIVLRSTEEGDERERYLEVYKLRNTPHAMGRHKMTIGERGITVTPRSKTKRP